MLGDAILEERQQSPQRRASWERCPWRKTMSTTKNAEHIGRCCPRRESTITTAQSLLERCPWRKAMTTENAEHAWRCFPSEESKQLPQRRACWEICAWRKPTTTLRMHSMLGHVVHEERSEQHQCMDSDVITCHVMKVHVAAWHGMACHNVPCNIILRHFITGSIWPCRFKSEKEKQQYWPHTKELFYLKKSIKMWLLLISWSRRDDSYAGF